MVEQGRQLDRLVIVIAGLPGTLGGSYYNIWPQVARAWETFSFLHSMFASPLHSLPTASRYFLILSLC